MIITIEDKDVKACQDLSAKYLRFNIGEKEIKEIIMSSPTLIAELATGNDCDTYFRDYFVMAVCDYVFKDNEKDAMVWPCNGDSDRYSVEFFADFLINIKEKNLDIQPILI